MWGAIPDHCPEPASESESSDASLSPCAPLESPEDSMLDLPLDPPLKSILKKGMDGKKRGGESSDSGKESDEDNKMEEEEDGGGEEDYEGEDEREDDYEDFHDCEGFDDRGEYSWNCYLTTIEEEEEEEVEPETEELLVEEEEDSGNDSDLEKSELETFEMLEKLCEIESKEKGEKTVRGRIQSYHEYKRLKEAAPVVVEYKNQIVVEKDLKGLKIKPVDEGAKEEANGSLDGMPEISDEGDSMAEFGQMEEFTGEYVESRSGFRGGLKEREIVGSITQFPAQHGGKMAKFGQMEECAVEHVENQESLGEASEVPFSGSNIQFTAQYGGKMAKFVQVVEFSGENEKSRIGFGRAAGEGEEEEEATLSPTTQFLGQHGGKKAKYGQQEECAGDYVDNQGRFDEACEKPFSGSESQFLAQHGGKKAKFAQLEECAGGYVDNQGRLDEACGKPFSGSESQFLAQHGGKLAKCGQMEECAGDYVDNQGRLDEACEKPFSGSESQFLAQHGGKKAKFGQLEEYAGDYVDNQGSLDEACGKPFSGSENQFLAQHGGKMATFGQLEEYAGDYVENQGSLGDVPRIRVSGQNEEASPREPEFDDDDEDQESVLEIKVPSDFDSDDIPSPWMVHKSDLRAVTLPRSFFDNPQVTTDDDVYSEIPVDSNKGGSPPGRSIPVGLRDGGGNGINKDESRAPVTSRAPMKHDPDTKIKSALKRASSKKRKKHKVQFDESLNKFFEADYVILIREECGGGGCDCGGGDYCYADEEDDDDVAPVAALDLAPFEPPVEFVDQLTLSPPDGYKDHCLHHGPLPGNNSHLPVTHSCGTHDDKGTERWPPEEPKCEDGQTQTTPTSESEDNDGPLSLSDVPDKKERYIVETITMTTVTERRIIREAEEAQGASVHAPPPHVSKDKEMTLTFKLGSNSLKPNSALRQLFPRIASPPPDKSPDSDDDSLQSNLIKRTIERNTLRRSLVRYPDIRKRAQAKKNENSLVERIKKLTCDIDDDDTLTPPARSSPTGEESKENAVHESTSTTTVLETSKIPAYRKITDIFIRNKEPHPVVLQAPASVEHQYPYYQPYNPPDLGNGMPKARQTHEARKQFLSSLAPLTACVSSHIDDTPGSRDSTSTVDTDYSIGDIDDVLKEQKPQPDIVVGTPGNESDELALFVQQDASRIERLRKRYSSAAGSDDEQDDYGFNRRPSVRGIKPRFGSTTEILQQMQSQIAPPLPSGSHVSWPYYPPDDRNGRYVEEPHYSQNVIHVQQGQSVRLPYQAGPVQLHLMGGPQSRQVVVRGTQTISTYYQIPRPAPEQFPRGPLVYYPRSPVCGSPTKMKLERGVPEGASASPHQEQAALLPPPPGPPGTVPPGPPVPSQALPVTDPPLMYAMNV